MAPSPTRHRIALAIALIGVAVGSYTYFVGHRLATDAGYTSFCNLGGVVNCDAVLSSRYGSFLEVPVSVWGIVTFAVGALLALPGAIGVGSAVADLLLLGLVAGSLGYALVLLGIASFVLHHACVLCLTLDVVIVAWFVTVLPLAARFHPVSNGPWLRRRAVAHAVTAAGLLLAIAGGTVAAVREPGTASTLDEIRTRDPKFVEFYTTLPVVAPDTVLDAGSPAKGAADAGITIVEFSDFECPACRQAFADLRELAKTEPDVRVVFRNYPLDSSCNPSVSRALHPNACLAAAAGECANRAGRFWEYHDVLFEHQQQLDRASLLRYARELGLDLEAFRTCLDDPATMARVRSDIEAGNRVGIASTPTLFINGRRLEGALERSYYAYALIIERNAADTTREPPADPS